MIEELRGGQIKRTTQDTTRKAWFAIPVSVVLHVFIFFLFFIPLNTSSDVTDYPDEALIIQPVQLKNYLVELGLHQSETEGENRGEQNQEAIADRLVKGTNNDLFSESRVNHPDLQPGREDLSSDIPENKGIPETGENGEREKVISKSSPVIPSISSPGGANRSGSSDRLGTFQLSSYEWNYAPYMNEWIRRIRRNWFEPISYLAGQGRGGRVLVRVTVSDEGKLKGIRYEFTNVNQEMTESALNAVLRSFTLPPLPEEFPDSLLTVTFNMVYPVF